MTLDKNKKLLWAPASSSSEVWMIMVSLYGGILKNEGIGTCKGPGHAYVIVHCVNVATWLPAETGSIARAAVGC